MLAAAVKTRRLRRFRHGHGVKHGHFIVIRSTPYEQLCPLAVVPVGIVALAHDGSRCRAVAAE
jgi:hypothetical protein